MSIEPFVALMRRHCIDYTNSHDQSVCDEIMHPDYVVHINGFDLPRDAAYKPAVKLVFDRFPGLGLVVHEFVTNGDRLAMRFSEHGACPSAQGHYAAWSGIGVYRWDGKQLMENYVEQDFLTQETQLASGQPAPLEPPHLDPWLGTRSAPHNPETERVARDWLAKGDLRDAGDVVIDGSWYEPLHPSPIDVADVTVNDLFTAGDRVAFHVTQTGTYRGGLVGAPAEAQGRETTLRCAGLARVRDGAVTEARVVTDRLGARTLLLKP
ncbi:ester cyclase [Mycobacterium vicinigordonae]|uniref:Ester cyclase n=1 Tax=Mycobacterium vicinigordonae TaxID=1719132 RepID=A0A7D6HWH9_9MYCO|nr:ester cyclase [Mycobacterium vicinigordonae]QLL06175.1 ester cyclase [Mycobacterium vicinigordonae]